MLKSLLPTIPLLLLLATSASAVCTSYSYTSCDDNIVHWFDPGTGEICDPINCGGGRGGPLRYDVPGCDRYTGTKTIATSASYLSCWTPSASASATSAAVGSGGSTTDTVATENSMASPTVSSTEVTSGSSATPSTTLPPDASADSQTTGDATASASDSAASAEPTDNAGAFGQGSLVAVAGAVIGAIALM